MSPLFWYIKSVWYSVLRHPNNVRSVFLTSSVFSLFLFHPAVIAFSISQFFLSSYIPALTPVFKTCFWRSIIKSELDLSFWFIEQNDLSTSRSFKYDYEMQIAVGVCMGHICKTNIWKRAFWSSLLFSTVFFIFCCHYNNLKLEAFMRRSPPFSSNNMWSLAKTNVFTGLQYLCLYVWVP